LIFTLGAVPEPQARNAPVFDLVTLLADQFKPSPENEKVPQAFLAVVKEVAR
jgi:hypothetical protein